jgi:hypothetical protein
MDQAIIDALRERGITLDEVLQDDKHTCTIPIARGEWGAVTAYCGKVARYATSWLRTDGSWCCHYRCQEHFDRLLKGAKR